MKHFFFLLFAILFFTLNSFAQATLPDTFHVTGYFFNSTGISRPIDTTKGIIQVAPNRYEAVIGDLASSYTFQFELDANNQLINWTPTGSAAVLPSGFMTSDNPGNFTFPNPGIETPGIGYYNYLFFPNEYNPLTRTIYMHYGYSNITGSSGESSYSRQIYEQWVLAAPRITSFSPASGTALSEITIRGKHFSTVGPFHDNVKFGNVYSDSIAIESDTLMKAWVSYGSTGKISIRNGGGIDSSSGYFTFIPVAVIDTQWRYVGSPGFSDNWSPFVNIACGSSNIPHVIYIDSAIKKALVKKYTGGNWAAVGSFVSDGKCSATNMVIDNNNNPVVVYCDSANGNKLTVKRFNGSAWQLLGNPGFAKWNDQRSSSPSIATDAANNIYVTSLDTLNSFSSERIISCYKFNGVSWVLTGPAGFAVASNGCVALAIDRSTNTPFVGYDINTGEGSIYPGQASVLKYNGTSWVQAGQTRITSSYKGIFYIDMAFDHAGVPYISVQDDDDFERTSVFKLSGNVWVPVGNTKFTHGHTFYSSLAIDSANNPLVLYRDNSYNQSGSVMTWNNTGSWKYVGERGFGPSPYYDQNSLVIDTNNIPMIAFGDYRHGGKVSVMMFISSRTVNDSLCANGSIAFSADNNLAGNTYRWQADNGSGFINITNNAIYSGALTNTLQLQTVPSNYYGYKYRCIIQNGINMDTSLIHTVHFANTWTGAVSSAWENPANWSCNNLPDANTDVIINSGTLIISSNVTIKSLYTGIEVSLNVSTGFNLIILD